MFQIFAYIGLRNNISVIIEILRHPFVQIFLSVKEGGGGGRLGNLSTILDIERSTLSSWK